MARPSMFISPYEEQAFKALRGAYEELYKKEREYGDTLKDILRDFNYEMAARGLMGSGAWVEGVSSRASDYLEKLMQRQAQLGGDLLRNIRGVREYEAVAGPSIAKTLAELYGTRGKLATWSDIMQMGALPRKIEEANIKAMLNDLFYRLGLGAALAGGFGTPWTGTAEVTQETSPLGFLGPGLGIVAVGIADYLRRLMG